MARYIVQRVLFTVPVLLGAVLFSFVVLQLAPGDPALVFLGQDASPEEIARIRRVLGLDEPVWVQFLRYVQRVVQGDLGRSLFLNEDVAALLVSAALATAELALVAFLIACVVGIPLGVLAAVRRGTWVDTLITFSTQLGVTLPVFWVAIVLMYVFAVELNWLPAVGKGDALPRALYRAATESPGDLKSAVAHLVLPAVSLAWINLATLTRIVRIAMVEVLDRPYIWTARAKGLSERGVIATHAFRNALIPVVSVMGLQLGNLLGGAVVTESIFGWPGLGRLFASAVSQRDYPLVQGAILLTGIVAVLMSLAVDLLYGVIDPRIRQSG